jgi:hypothetical protein
MTLKEALQVKLPNGKPLGVATLKEIAEFGKLVADLMVDPKKLEVAADDDPIWEQATANAKTLERYREVQDAIFTLWQHGYTPPPDEGETVQ